MTETPTRQDTDAEPEIDRELLAEARRHLNDAHPNEAINVALRDFVEAWRERRREALENLRRMSREGAFDYSVLDEDD